MAIVYGTNNPPDSIEFLDMTASQAQQYGLHDDRVTGLGGNDFIITGLGNDILSGDNGNDVLSDGGGNDSVYAGAGDDLVKVDAGNDVYHGGSGSDTLSFSVIHVGASGGEDNYTGIKLDRAGKARQDFGEFGIDEFYGFENATGSYGHDTIYGTNSVNSLMGLSGNDKLYGRGGNDTLTGGSGADLLVGGQGADAIYTDSGNAAPDTSRDIIRYESLKDSGTTASTRDVVYGFKAGQDRIDLSKLDANLALKGNQAFKVVTGFTKAFGEIKLVKSGFDTIVQVDGDKDSAVDMTILVKNADLTKADFIL